MAGQLYVFGLVMVGANLAATIAELRNLTQKLMVYATGADIQFADREEVREDHVHKDRDQHQYGGNTLAKPRPHAPALLGDEFALHAHHP